MDESSGSMGTQDEVKQDAERVKSLLGFASGILTARERVQMRMADTRMGVFREEDVMPLPGVHVATDDGEWLRIRRQSPTKPNDPGKHVAVFLANDGSDPDRAPGLKPAVTVVVPIEEASDLAEADLLREDNAYSVVESGVVRDDVVRVTLLAEDLNEMQSDCATWLSSVWAPWAEREKPIRKSIALYDSLFRIHAAVHAADGVPPEIIWGFGLGHWTEGGTTVEMPLVEQEMDTEVLAGGDLVLTPRERPLELSLKPYLELEVPGSAALQRKLSDLLASVRQGDTEVTPADFTTLNPILSTAASQLDSQGRLLEGPDLPAGAVRAGDGLQIAARWAIYVRPRSSAARVQDLRKLVQAIDEMGAPPSALKGFVAPEADAAPDGNPFGLDATVLGATTVAAGPRDDELVEPGMKPGPKGKKRCPDDRAYFFPLPYNAEQAAIIDTLEGRNGAHPAPVVSVTGPPGTGKSHTIANLVAHAMAKGHRVLVTARTAEAISVVREKLPDSLRALVIASTGTDRVSIESLKSAVAQLSEEIVTMDMAAANRRREELEATVLDCDARMQEADVQLAAIARANLTLITVDGERLTPMELAPRVAEGREAHGWFDDRPAKAAPGPIGEAVNELRGALPRLALDLGLVGTELPGAADLPTVEAVLEAHAHEAARKSRPVLDASAYPPMAVNGPEDLSLAKDLLGRLNVLENHVGTLQGDQTALFEGLHANQAAPDAFARVLNALRMLKLDPAQAKVSFPKHDPLDALKIAAGRGAAGQKPAPGLFNRSIKRSVANVRVGDAPPASSNDWLLVEATISIELDDELIRSVLSELPSGRDWTNGARRGWEMAQALCVLQDNLARILEMRQGLIKAASDAKCLFPVDMDLEPVRRGQITNLALALEANIPNGTGPHPAREALLRLGQRGKHPLFERLAQLGLALGEADTDPADLVRERADLTSELARLVGVKTDIAAADARLSELAGAGAPKWAARLRETPEAAEDLVPADWLEAWRWAITAGQLETVVEQGNGDDVRTRKVEAGRRRERAMEELIRVRTMLGLKARMTSSVQRAMQSFTQAVSRVGKGTGKTAPRYRAAAQREAQKVATAAPVWIMPEHRIGEQLPPDIEAFDLVILDEASQSDITAVAALARGKQVLVVGDEEQVSPSNVGVPRQKIDALRAEYLATLPNADLIDENTSIFEITLRMHPEHHLVLREHFRCVAPIIQFSTQFYNNRLIPIRMARPSERFDPPLVDVHLDGARRKGKSNLDEATFIVDEISELVADARHEHRDIGVVSLLGSEQAMLIEQLLLKDERVGPEVMRTRNIICGDARTLQGQERSVVFLSMVATPEAVISQTKREIQQRLNVAMSRAKDRVYLVRSVAAEDLKRDDLKAKVLQHFEDPMPTGRKIDGSDLMDQCDSRFEKEVLGRLLDAGYRAIPQTPAGAYRIDIVVEGSEDRRLAIELDGDAYHGPEKWDEDMARQEVLERAGWVFWRVFGSQWEHEKEYWWRDLLDTLARMQIEPLGAERLNGAFVELRTLDVRGVSSVPAGAADLEDEETPPAPAPEPLAEHDTGPRVAATNGSADASGTPPAQAHFLDALSEGAPAPDFEKPERGNVEIAAGCRVRLEMDDGEERVLDLVSSSANPEQGRILTSSPLGEALLGALAGEEVEFPIGERTRSAHILDVTFLQDA